MLAGLLPLPVIKAVSHAQWHHPWLRRGFEWCADRLRNQDGTIRQGSGKGLRFNPGRANAGFLLGTSEPTVQKVLQRLVRSGSVVYDIGANVGFLTIIAARLVGPEGFVFAFEPVAENFRQIEHNAGLNGFGHIVAWRMAIADSDGMATFQVSSTPTWGKLGSIASEIADPIGQIEVTVRRLDTVVKEEGLPFPHLIKIDVQGSEASVLDGAVETIQKYRPTLMIELHGTNLAISERLRKLNYFPAVLGSPKSIVRSPWDAYIVAFPETCAELDHFRNCELGSR